MKILCIFLDSIRPNRLGTFNNKIRPNTFDSFINSFGGDIYTNAYTPGPDSPRSTSAFLTGIHPNKNGCNTRLKWPQFYLKETENIFDFFQSMNYKIDCFSPLNEIKNGFYPKNFNPINYKNNHDDYLKFLKDLKLENDHFIFLSFPDLHRTMDDYGANKIGEQQGYIILSEILKTIFEIHDKDSFDDIIIFSDHGYKLSREYKFQKQEFLLNFDRTNIFFLHRKKGESNIIFNNLLLSTEDIFSVFKKIVNEEKFSFNRQYVLIEDHIDFSVTIDQKIEQWALAFKDYIYVRSKTNGAKFFKTSKKVDYAIDDSLDDIIKLNSKTFKKFNDKEKSIIRYDRNIKNNDLYYSNLKERKVRSRIIKRIYDILSELVEIIQIKT